MSPWKDEDIAILGFMEEYLGEFREGILNNPKNKLSEDELEKVELALDATHKFTKDMLTVKKRQLYMHDMILMAIGFYGGYLTSLEDTEKWAFEDDEECGCGCHEEHEQCNCESETEQCGCGCEDEKHDHGHDCGCGKH